MSFRTLCLALAWAVAAVGARAEVVERFSSYIDVQRDGTLVVREEITVDFGPVARHGIFRYIPVKYQRKRLSYNLRLKFLSVTDERGRRYKYEVSRWGRNKEVRIGDPRKTVTGRHVYVITYRVGRALNFFKTHDELYWNVTGTEWRMPINSVEAAVRLPDGVERAAVRYQAFVGALGERKGAFRARWQGDSLRFFAGPLAPGEGLTIVVGIPKGAIAPPSKLREALAYVGDNWPAVVLPLLTLVAMTMLWLHRGRDPLPVGPVPVQYEPPEGLSPAEVGTIFDEQLDSDDVLATLIDLAARGYIKIRALPAQKLFLFSKRDYEFVLLRDYHGDEALQPHEEAFLRGLFGYKGKRAPFGAEKQVLCAHPHDPQGGAQAVAKEEAVRRRPGGGAGEVSCARGGTRAPRGVAGGRVATVGHWARPLRGDHYHRRAVHAPENAAGRCCPAPHFGV